MTLGLRCDGEGASVAVWSERAEQVWLCLFDGPERRIPLDRDGPIWRGRADVAPGTPYGLRAAGRWAPEEGHVFNPAKLLHDPYALAHAGIPRWHPALHAGNPEDSAPHLPKCLAAAPLPPLDTVRPATPWDRTVIYEAHVKGLTQLHPAVPEADRGSYRALGHPAILDHLTGLGITALGLLPVQAFMTEPRLEPLGLTNYWGYNTHGFFAPDPRYGSAEDLRGAVQALHAAGIEVILDVVYNHTAEGDAHGPCLHLRGLDDGGFYRRHPEAPTGYVNHTGTGNTLDVGQEGPRRLILDSLRHWATAFGVDGFRFDLAPVLARDPEAVAPDGRLLTAIAEDPVLGRLKLIAEPWDIGPGGYAAGRFPAPWAEWNDGFRDTARRAWRGDPGGMQALAGALLGSADRFEPRPPWASVNYVASHDGFTLADQTMFAERRNQANGEDGRDGHAGEVSDPLGPDGPSDDPAVAAARGARRRALLATVLVAQGTPMIRAGDELGQSQGGNNNAYCQDNRTTWIDWGAADGELMRQAAEAIGLRAATPALRQGRHLHDPAEVRWLGLDGGPPDWRPDMPGVLLWLTPATLVAVNLGAARPLALPPGPWRRAFGTEPAPERTLSPGITVFTS